MSGTEWTPEDDKDPDKPSEDYYYCDESGCENKLEGMDFVYGVCPKHREAIDRERPAKREARIE